MLIAISLPGDLLCKTNTFTNTCKDLSVVLRDLFLSLSLFSLWMGRDKPKMDREFLCPSVGTYTALRLLSSSAVSSVQVLLIVPLGHFNFARE
jgi:hypothetical protein